ncbi:MAG: hypothetical protein ABH822_01380 [Patescibacteria group bacterium]
MDEVKDLIEKKIFPPCRVGDLNKDCIVNLQDISILFYAWQKQPDKDQDRSFFASILGFDYLSPDINNDRRVDLSDLSIMLANWTA